MKLNLRKRSFKSLSTDSSKLPDNATPAIAGGINTDLFTSFYCPLTHNVNHCDYHNYTENVETVCCFSSFC